MTLFTQRVNEKEKRLKRNEESLRDLRNNIHCKNFHIIGVPEGNECERWVDKLFEEIMAENFPKLMKEKDIQIHGGQSPNQNEPKEIHTKTHHNENGKA